MLFASLFLTTLALANIAPAHDSPQPASNKAASDTATVLEVLSMPEANRISVAQSRGTEIYLPLKNIAFDPDRSLQTRWKALLTMAQADKNKAVKDLNVAAQQKDWFMKNAALSAMKMTHPLQAREMALRLLKDKALIVRSAAVATLDSPLEPQEREALWSELTRPYNFHRGTSLWVRPQILNRLSENPQKNEARAFAAALKEKDGQMHVSAIIALEKITGQKFGNKKSTVGQKKNLALDYMAKSYQTASSQIY